MAKTKGTTRSSSASAPNGIQRSTETATQVNGINFSPINSWGQYYVSGKAVDDIRRLGIEDFSVGRIIAERYGDIQNGGGDSGYGFVASAGRETIANYVKDWAEGARLLYKYRRAVAEDDEPGIRVGEQNYREWEEAYRRETQRRRNR